MPRHIVTRCQLGREGGWVDFMLAIPVRVHVDSRGVAKGVTQENIQRAGDLSESIEDQSLRYLLDQAEAVAAKAIPTLDSIGPFKSLGARGL